MYWCASLYFSLIFISTSSLFAIMPVIIYKPERKVIVDGISRVVSKHEQWYCRDEKKDFQCNAGIIKKEFLKPGKIKVGNNEFVIIPAGFLDNYKRIRRDAQIITRKDIGFLIGFCGLGKDSIILESGGGSGSATILFAHICKKIYSVEIDKENLEVVRENLAHMNIKNAVTKLGNIYDPKSVPVKNADFMLLDVPEPWQAIPSAKKALKLGGYLVAYTPSVIQAQKFLQELSLTQDFLVERTTEIIDRDWKIKGDAVRPVTADIGHTAFLTIVRRIL